MKKYKQNHKETLLLMGWLWKTKWVVTVQHKDRKDKVTEKKIILIIWVSEWDGQLQSQAISQINKTIRDKT